MAKLVRKCKPRSLFFLAFLNENLASNLSKINEKPIPIQVRFNDR